MMKSEQQNSANTYPGDVKKFMSEKGWHEHQCEQCSVTFFAKSATKHNTPICGWHKCDTGGYLFRTFSKRKQLMKPAQISARMDEYFRTAGFNSVTPLDVTNVDGQTDLVIAGVQMFDDIIHRNQPLRNDRVFVAQPCVRMQFQPQVATQEGTSTSFVNVCTEQMGASFDGHLRSVDHWLTILSKLGLHMNDFVVVMRVSQNDWGTGTFSSLELFFCYGGLELGDAAYLQVPQSSRAAIPISDIGFGLERIAWAINKTESYFDVLMPWTASGTREMFDACRTIALLVFCGVQATNKGPGLQFRRFAKVLGEKYYGAHLFEILPYYFDYWAQFVMPSIKQADAVMLARLEIERFVNLKICAMLDLPPPRDETTDAYLNRLVYTCNASIHELRQAIQICKT
jgi:hypothetical protein